jgi:hypothetical protein
MPWHAKRSISWDSCAHGTMSWSRSRVLTSALECGGRGHDRGVRRRDDEGLRLPQQFPGLPYLPGDSLPGRPGPRRPVPLFARRHRQRRIPCQILGPFWSLLRSRLVRPALPIPKYPPARASCRCRTRPDQGRYDANRPRPEVLRNPAGGAVSTVSGELSGVVSGAALSVGARLGAGASTVRRGDMMSRSVRPPGPSKPSAGVRPRPAGVPSRAPLVERSLGRDP